MFWLRISKLLVFWLLISSCVEEEKQVTNLYLDFDSLLDKQVLYLHQLKGELHKRAWINGREEKKILSGDSSQWEKELGLFRKLNNVNNAKHRNAYSVVKDRPDPNSNLRIGVIATEESFPISYLKVFYKRTMNQPKKIEGLYQEKNSLYTGTRKLILEFSDIGNQQLVTSYFIRGHQKLIFGDSVSYSIRGTFRYPH